MRTRVRYNRKSRYAQKDFFYLRTFACLVVFLKTHREEIKAIVQTQPHATTLSRMRACALPSVTFPGNSAATSVTVMRKTVLNPTRYTANC
jgi:hypothetical protein